MSDRANRGSGSHAAVFLPASEPRRRIYSLVVHGREIFLHTGTHTLGRALTCDIVVNDRLVSREHARIVVRDNSAMLVDLGSTNGVYLNEVRIEGAAALHDGDLIVIGTKELTVRAVVSDDQRTTSPDESGVRSEEEISEVISRDTPPSSGRIRMANADSGPTEQADSARAVARIGAIHAPDARSDDAPRNTEKADALLVLGRLADRAMVMGNYEGAELVLRSHLEALLAAARSDVAIPDAQRETACRYALRLADALRRPAWVDYAVEMHLIAGKPMSEWCTSRMVLIVPVVPGVDAEQLFFYQQMLKGSLADLPPEERSRAEQIIALQPGR
jgi:pSer/pThr/pTyr-binding forkhead associated (FHA) protein